MENGYGITDKDKWYGIVDEWEKLNEQADQLKETVSEINTGIKFDEARDGLDDLLLSADTTFRDISDNFEGYMRKSVLNMVKSRYLNEEMQNGTINSSKGLLMKCYHGRTRRLYGNNTRISITRLKTRLTGCLRQPGSG